MATSAYDAIVVGAGFYGLSLALHLGDKGMRILLVEAEREPMSRASMVNQARVHSGFHYPRSFVTALRSFRNYQRFVDDFRPAIFDGFNMLYAVARYHSKVNAKRFQTMFAAMGAPIEVAAPAQCALFDHDYIEAVFACKEAAVDCSALRDLLLARLKGRAVELLLGIQALSVRALGGTLVVTLSNGTTASAPLVFNATYSRLNELMTGSGYCGLPLKHELAEIALIEPPAELAGSAVTVVDGPFFSVMPFPGRKLYSFSHVRYTPHVAWHDNERNNLYTTADGLLCRSNWLHMKKDAQRYVPSLARQIWRESLFAIKTVPLDNESDDGRPILFQVTPELPGFYSILGSKLDNIYDLFEAVDFNLITTTYTRDGDPEAASTPGDRVLTLRRSS